MTVIPGEGVSNVARVNQDRAQIGLTHSAIAAAAVAGNDPFSETLDNVATVASLYPSTLQFFLRADLDVGSIEDLVRDQRDVRISVDSPGSTGALAFKRTLAAYGATYEDIESWGGAVLFKNMSDSSDMVSDGRLDGFSTMTLAPAAPVQEMARNRDLSMYSLKPGVLADLTANFGYSESLIAAQTYDFQPEEVYSISSYTVVIVPRDAPDELAYRIAKSMVEKLDYLRSVHVALSELTPEAMAGNLGAPMHPGAERYYREAGILPTGRRPR